MEVRQKFDQIQTRFYFYSTSFDFFLSRQACSNGPNICLTDLSYWAEVKTIWTGLECYFILFLCFFFFRSVSEVTVSHVDDPTHFFIQQNHNWEQNEALSTKLNEFFQVI